MPKERTLVSISLPSLRPDSVSQRIADWAETNKKIDYELVVVSPFEVAGPNVVHVPELEPKGAIYGQYAAYEHCQGDYIVWMSDDAIPDRECLINMVNFVKAHPDPFIGVFRIHEGGKKGEERGRSVMYGKDFACWGCASRKTIDMIGGYFDPIYHALFGDPDLSLRCWKAGGRVEVCPTSWITHRDVLDQLKGGYRVKWTEIDGKICHDRWDPIYGREIATATYAAGGLAAPLPFWRNPFLWLAWNYRNPPSERDWWVYRTVYKPLLYKKLSRLPFYFLYRAAKRLVSRLRRRPKLEIQ
jgi:hypothetical protein